MQRWCAAAALAACGHAQALAGVPQMVLDSCLAARSHGTVRYVDLSPSVFTIEEDGGDSTVTVAYRGRQVGIRTAAHGAFGLVAGGATLSAARIVGVGGAVPAPFDPYLARWGEARHGKRVYLCITFQHAGLGRSGAFQRVRAVYVGRDRSLASFYYATGIVRMAAGGRSRGQGRLQAAGDRARPPSLLDSAWPPVAGVRPFVLGVP